MIIDLNKNLVDLDDKEIQDANMGKMVSTLLARDNKGDALKFFDWARRLHKGIHLDLDPTDKDKLRSFVINHEELSNLSKAQIAREIDNAKEVTPLKKVEELEKSKTK